MSQRKHWTMHCRRHDKTRIPANTNLIGQSLTIPIRSRRRNNAKTRDASIKHAQTIGILEGTHASIKTALKISTGERRSMWHKYVQIAVMNYTTTYHETLGCEPFTVFHGRIPYNVLDLKLGIKPKWKSTPNSDIADQLQQQIDEVRATTNKYHALLSRIQEILLLQSVCSPAQNKRILLYL